MNAFYSDRPKIRFSMTAREWAMQAVSIVCLLAAVVMTAVAYPGLPQVIPTHMDFYGNINGWGGKGLLFLLPLMAMTLYALITVVQRFPHVYNYPVAVTQKNAESLYRLARLMLDCIKMILSGMFLFLQWIVISTARQGARSSNSAFLLVFIALLLGVAAYFIYKMFRVSRI